MSEYRKANENHIVGKNKRFVDARTFGEKLGAALINPNIGLGVTVSLSIISFVAPLLLPLICLTILPLFSTYLKYSKKNKLLPMKLPKAKFPNTTDFHQNKPGQTEAFDKAKGQIFIGNEKSTMRQVWADPKDFLVHLLYIASTGGGKTDSLVSMAAATSFITGGGQIYVDAKAAASIIFQFATLARIVGREHHLRFISYRTGNKTVLPRSYDKLSNSNAPFSNGTADVCVQIIEGVMPKSDPSSQYFKDRGVSALKSTLPALCEMRDANQLNISPGLIAAAAEIPNMIKMAYPEYFDYKFNYRPAGSDYDVIIPNKLTNSCKDNLKMYLKNLPDFSDKKEDLINPANQNEQVNIQHGFGKGYFLRALSNMSFKYGHIYEHEVGEADYTDCLLQNRILIVMVPAIQDSKDDRQALGKLNLSALKIAMSESLGDISEGDYDDVIAKLPIDKQTPSHITIDEYAEVAVEGFAITATQGRGLGCSTTYSGQDLAGFIAASKEETAQIFGSTKTKMLGTLLDVEETWDWFKKLAGTHSVVKSGGYTRGEGLATYDKNLQSSIEEVDRIDINDFTRYVEGEVTIFWQNKLIHTQLFHYGIAEEDLAQNFRFNRLSTVLRPNHKQKARIERELNNIELLKNTLSNKVLKVNIETNEIDNYPVDKDSHLWILESLRKSETRTKQRSIREESSVPAEMAKNDEPNQVPQKDVSIGQQKLTEKWATTTPVGQFKSGEIKKGDFNKEIEEILRNAENSWIFKYESDKGARNRGAEMHAALTDVISSIGISSDTSSRKAAQTIRSFTDSVKYTTMDVTTTESEMEELWEEAFSDLES